MNQVRLNEFGLAELLASDLNKIAALASTARYLLTNDDGPVYLREATELMAVIQDLTGDAEQLRAEWQMLISRFTCQCSGGIR